MFFYHSIKTIGEAAFFDCPSLASFYYYSNNPPKCDGDIFNSNINLTTIIVSYNYESESFGNLPVSKVFNLTPEKSTKSSLTLILSITIPSIVFVIIVIVIIIVVFVIIRRKKEEPTPPDDTSNITTTFLPLISI